MSQDANILAHLRAGHSLTPTQAFYLFGTVAMHSRAATLREAGHKIVCEVRRENGKRFGIYSLAP